MRVVVTGATGFVGQWLVDELLRQEDEVTVIVRNARVMPERWRDKVQVVEASLEQYASLTVDDFFCAKVDIFFHFAWDGAASEMRGNTKLQLENVQYTCDAVRLAAQLHCSRFVNAGSIMEYEAMSYIPQNGAEPGVSNVYSIAKLTADCMAKTIAVKENVAYINVIISNIYGIGEKSARFLKSTIKKMMTNEEIPLTHGEQLYDFIYVEDAVKAIILAGKEGESNSSYYIGNVTQRPLKDFVNEMHMVLESNSCLKFGEIPFKGARLKYDEFDTKGLVKLGFTPQVTFAEGVIRTRDWMMGVEDEN